MNTLQAVPPVLQQESGEDITYTFDFTPNLPGGQTPTLPVSALVDLTNRSTAVTLADSPSVAGNTVVQRVRPILVAGHTYRLLVRCTPSTTTNIETIALGLICPF